MSTAREERWIAFVESNNDGNTGPPWGLFQFEHRVEFILNVESRRKRDLDRNAEFTAAEFPIGGSLCCIVPHR